jgi:hypothetical protein
MREQLQAEKSIFLAAIEIHAAAERAAFLEEACAGNPSLRAEVEALLRAHAQPQRLLDLPEARVRTEPEAGKLTSDHCELCSTSADPGASDRESPGAGMLSPPDPGTVRAPRLQDSSTPTLSGYEILGEVGRGGMGVVYRARDVLRNQVIALKTMQRFDATALYRFKQEFRSLAGISHRNLVTLYDLVADREQWFFTMEFVEGVNFLEHVRSPARAAPTAPLRALSSAQLIRLRQALRQLAEGVNTLHEAAKLHRDIKPSNVLVAADGRVVLLDFGVATELDQVGWDHGNEEHIVGTFAYMAPEQGTGLALNPAADWYSVGVLLYETLTGRLPYVAPSLQVLKDKREKDPPAPREVVGEVPDDLDRLCMDLLCRDPARRPDGREVARRLGEGSIRSAVGAVPATAPQRRIPLIGRERHLAGLEEAYATSRQRRAVLVTVHGPSGIGKSALVRHFLERLRGREAVVLAGRCHEHEFVPYKALDPLVDDLGRHLRGRPQDEVEALLPRDIAALTRVFPVLGRIPAVAEAAARCTLSSDPREVRRQAFAALRELLARVGNDRPLVLHIDDLQWGDVDSAHLLVDLLRPPDPPALLLVTSYRSEDADSPCLRALAEALGHAGAIDRRELVVAPLSGMETRELVLRLLGSGAEPRTEEIARESGGNPFFITELVQEVHSGTGPDAAPPQGKITLEGLIQLRAGRLPEGARRLLEVVAVSSRPLAELQAYRAAEVGADGRVLMARLESARFLRGTGSSEEGFLETYHDRIRETVVTGLPPERLRDHHRRLADVLEESGRGDPEQVAVHFEGAGDRDKAGTYYALAADRAAKALAFDQAANLYQRSLGLQSLTQAEGRKLRVKWGDALADAGRGAEAGPVLLDAAEGATALEGLELRRRAAEQFLVSGHIREGADVLQLVLGAVGMRLADGRRRVLLGMLLERVRLRLRGLNFRERSADSTPAEELLRIDACETAFMRLCMWDVPQSILFQTRQLRLALRAGEPFRIGIGLAGEAGFVALQGGPGRARAERVLNQANRLAERLDHPLLLAYTAFNQGLMTWAVGRWRESLTCCDRAEEIATERQVSFAIERTKLQHFSIDCLVLLGQWRELARRLPAWLADARRCGDRFAAGLLLTHSYVPCLAAGKPDHAEEVIRQAQEEWPTPGGSVLSFWSVFGRAEAALYRGEGGRARELIIQGRPFLKRSTETSFVLAAHLRARVALAVAAVTPTGGWLLGRRARLLRTAARDAGRIERRRMPWAEPLARLTRAGISAVRRRNSEALAQLTDAEDGFTAADMSMFAAVARRQRGRLLGGEEGRALVESADAWMTGQGVSDPARITAMLAPGFEAPANEPQ